MANTPGRIVTPRGPKAKLEQAAKIYAKHKNDGAASELNNLVDYSWDTTGPTIQKALDWHEKAETLKGQMEEAYSQRDAVMKPIADIDAASAKYLKGKYSNNPKKLADWGYAIDDTPPAKKPKKSDDK